MSEELLFDTETIGEVAGEVWHTLDQHEEISLSKLSRLLNHHPRDLVMQGLGWLAREDKIQFQTGVNHKTVSLKAGCSQFVF